MLQLSGHHVLVVADDPMTAFELRIWLIEQGCTPLGPVGTHAAAADVLSTATPDAAIVDLDLSGIDVVDVLAELPRRGVPVVPITARLEALPEHLQAFPVLGKPLNLTLLRQVLHEVVRAKRRPSWARASLPSVDGEIEKSDRTSWRPGWRRG